MAKLIKKTKGKKQNVFDLEVETSHNFIVNGICVHNSSSKPNF